MLAYFSLPSFAAVTGGGQEDSCAFSVLPSLWPLRDGGSGREMDSVREQNLGSKMA